MRSRFVALVSLALAAVTPAALAQGTAAPASSGAPPEGTFYYHWETPERLLLWQDLDQLVGVTVELRNGEWLPGDKQGLLRQLAEELKNRYPEEEDRAVVQEQWKGSLAAALNRSGGDYKKWLEPLRAPNGPTPGFIPRQPDVMIYLHVDTAAKKARMRLLSGLAAVGSQAYELSQKEEGQTTVWKSSGVPIETAMGVKWEPARILEIAGLKGSDVWTVLIDAWKANPAGFSQQRLYKTSNGKTAWAWFELVDNEGLLRLSGTKGPVRIMPTLAPTPPLPVPPKPKPPISTVGDQAVVWLLIGQIWLFASGAFLVVRSYLLSRPVLHTARSEQGSMDLEKTKDEFEFQQLRGIEVMLRSAHHKWRQNSAEEDSLPKQGAADWLQGVPDLIAELEESKRSLAGDLDTQKSLVTAANQKISELEGEQTTLKEERDSLQSLVTAANQKISELEGERTTLKEERDSLQSLVTAANQKISGLEGEQTTLQGQRNSLQQALESAKRERAEAEKALRGEIKTWKLAEANARRDLGASERTVGELRDQFNTANNENTRLQRTLQNLGQAAQQLEAVGAVDAVSPFLRRGQNQFLDETDVQSAGLLAVLVTHSLNQLALSRALCQETKASAMLWNLHHIASRLGARYSGFKLALPPLQELGAGDTPLADNLIAVNAQHEDSKLFQLILKQLRTAHRIDLAPFYFDVTKDGQVVRAN